MAILATGGGTPIPACTYVYICTCIYVTGYLFVLAEVLVDLHEAPHHVRVLAIWVGLPKTHVGRLGQVHQQSAYNGVCAYTGYVHVGERRE